MLVFEERGKLTFEKSLGARERTNNKLNPHMASTLGFEPGPHWREASVLTTEPPLPYHVIITSVEQLSVEPLHMEKHDSLILFPSQVKEDQKKLAELGLRLKNVGNIGTFLYH